jgi:hypothetical protein
LNWAYFLGKYAYRLLNTLFTMLEAWIMHYS